MSTITDDEIFHLDKEFERCCVEGLDLVSRPFISNEWQSGMVPALHANAVRLGSTFEQYNDMRDNA